MDFIVHQSLKIVESGVIPDHAIRAAIRAEKVGVQNVVTVVEMGNPKVLLANDIPSKEGVDLIMVGATGLNAFERLMVGSSSEYILRHAKVDLLVVRDKDKTM